MQTDVELLWLEGRIERWIRFGQPVAEQIIDRRRRVVSFEPGSIFALVRWRSNDFGTIQSRIDIVRAVRPEEAFTTVPFVALGGEVLLHIGGWPKVQQVLEMIDAVERLRLDPSQVSPDYWRQVHNRLVAGEAPSVYTRERHCAWRLRQRLGS